MVFEILSTVAVLLTFPDKNKTSPTFTSVIKLVPLPVKKAAVLDATLSVEVPLILCVTMFNEKGLTVKSPEASNVLLAIVFSISPNTGYLISSVFSPFSTLNNSIKSISEFFSIGSVIPLIYVMSPGAGDEGLPKIKYENCVGEPIEVTVCLPLYSSKVEPLTTITSPTFKLWSVAVVILTVPDLLSLVLTEKVTP